MISIIKLRYLMEQNAESSRHEESPPVPSTSSNDSITSVDPTSSTDSTSSVNTISTDEPTSTDDPTSSADSTLSVNTISTDEPTSTDNPTSSADSTLSVNTISTDEPTSTDDSTSTVVPISSVGPISSVDSISPVPSTSRGIEENSDDFRFEAARRSSFRNCPESFINAASLAAAGYYYTGIMDKVRCFECQLMISYWIKDHTPMQIHKMCSPDCRFVRNEHCDNVPIGADPDKIMRVKRSNRDIYCRYGLQYHEAFDFKDHKFLRYLRNPTAYELSRLGLKKVKEPENLQYATYQSRLNSFATWPTYMTQTKEVLADAGFYYTQNYDFTICYHCGIDIGNWKSGEDPWEQHAIWSPTCCYLLTVRGCQYVNDVTGKQLYETSAETPTQTTVGNDASSSSGNKSNEMTLVEKVAALEEENRALSDARSCKVCMEREATITFLPCGHLATCHYCSPAFKKCIICRREIKAINRIFLA